MSVELSWQVCSPVTKRYFRFIENGGKDFLNRSFSQRDWIILREEELCCSYCGAEQVRLSMMEGGLFSDLLPFTDSNTSRFWPMRFQLGGLVCWCCYSRTEALQHKLKDPSFLTESSRLIPFLYTLLVLQSVIHGNTHWDIILRTSVVAQKCQISSSVTIKPPTISEPWPLAKY